MCSLLNQPASNMIHKSEWCWDTAEEGQSLRGEAWSGRVWALKGRTPLPVPCAVVGCAEAPEIVPEGPGYRC
jgi:hypothetical protein